MNENLQQSLQSLGAVLEELSNKPQPIDYKLVVKNIPHRALSGDHITGGVIRNFSSSGIKDNANDTKITIDNDKVSITNLAVDTVQGNLTVTQDVTVNGIVKAGKIVVDELVADLRIERTSPLEFKATKDNSIYGKGLVWLGEGPTKQLVLKNSPDRIFSSESFEVAQNKAYYIGEVKVIDVKELSPTIQKSNLKEVGNLKNLTVIGSVNINNHVYYDSGFSRLGIGTDHPNSSLSVVENGVEIVLGTGPNGQGRIGTFTSNDLEILTDNTTRFVIQANGDISLGNQNKPNKTTIHGKLTVGVSNPDPQVDLHVSGSIKFADKLQAVGTAVPVYGQYKIGDIIWNSNPQPGNYVGWVCIASGTPGQWRTFGLVS